MSEGRASLVVSAHRALDLALTLAALLLAAYAKTHLLPDVWAGLSVGPSYTVLTLLVLIIWTAALSRFGGYQRFGSADLSTVTLELAKGLALAVAVLITSLFALKIGEDISRLFIGLFLVIDFAVLLASKGLLLAIRRRWVAKDGSLDQVLVVGSREQALDVIRPLADRKRSSCHVIGCLDPDESNVGRVVHGDVRVIGSMGRFIPMLRQRPVDQVVFAMPLAKIEGVEQYVDFAELMGVDLRFVPEWGLYKLLWQPRFAQRSFDGSLGVPTLFVSSKPGNRNGLLLKEVFDRVTSLLAVVTCAPLFVAVAAAIRLTSKGPVLFRQERSGLNGRIFTLYKFRTMVADAEQRRRELETRNQMDGPVFKLADDPRVTSLGRFLRRSSLDELPQLFNILKGDMSFVGPRPPIPAEVRRYETWQRRRLSMKPGLTCIWQTSGRNRIGFEEWMRLDLQYIDHWSWSLDLRLLLKTIPAVLSLSGDNAVDRHTAGRPATEAGDPAPATAPTGGAGTAALAGVVRTDDPASGVAAVSAVGREGARPISHS